MKTLLIVRHAKSDWDDPKLSDFQRPLNSRGHKNAPEMAHRLLRKKIVPQQIVSSPANRAITTAAYFSEAFGIEKSAIIQIPAIYEASSRTLLEIINNLDNQHDFIALFGHNPGITNLVTTLCQADIYNIPTCGMAFIEFPFDDWEMISEDTGELKLYDFPKNPG
ncbi:MAG TPA: histidine phosphatase family protein [Sphingobacteriaceae bacterium]|nr:histidine phosphatase family protein [Sphingobacteriaceae bacterium]